MSLSGDSETELRGYFEKLAAGGTIEQPLVPAPWGDTFGSLRDKVGVKWMVILHTVIDCGFSKV